MHSLPELIIEEDKAIYSNMRRKNAIKSDKTRGEKTH